MEADCARGEPVGRPGPFVAGREFVAEPDCAGFLVWRGTLAAVTVAACVGPAGDGKISQWEKLGRRRGRTYVWPPK